MPGAGGVQKELLCNGGSFQLGMMGSCGDGWWRWLLLNPMYTYKQLTW